ncbi:hypothetical protein [Halobacteriovorax marinus]|uniref:hypothetical protein n=1 Tax=Halobacteriovorax marinus TaxID=97084 RepID=UPI003A93F97F
MKTIFSYLAKCFLTYTLTFALLQVQVLIPVQNLQHLSGVAYAANDRVSVDEDGVATKSGSVELENSEPNTLLEHLAMISMGFFTFKAVSACQPRPWDVLTATAGGVIYIGAELFSFNAFKDLKENQKINYKNKENGDNETQVEMLKAQKKGYEDIAEAAKTKAMIQTAAAATYGIAAIMALAKSLQWFSAATTCTAGCSAASAGTLQEALKAMEGVPSAIKAKDLYAACAAKKTEVAAVASSNAVSATACTAIAATCAIDSTMCATEVAICMPGAFSMFDVFGVGSINREQDAIEKFVRNGLKIPGIDQVLNDELVTEIVKETKLKELQDHFAIPSFIEEVNPFYDLNKKMVFDETNFESQINSYAKNRDMSRFFQGELSSTSIESFYEFKKNMADIEVNSSSSNLGETLKLAFENGMDLMIPSAQASSLSLMLGTSLAIFIAINKTTVFFADNWIATPGKRSLLWTAAAGLAFAAASSSKKVQEDAEENAEKIQEIITKLSSQGLKKVDSMGGSQLTIPSKIPFKIKGNNALSLGPDKVPCADKKGVKNCGSIRSGIEKSQGFTGLGGNLGSLAGAAGAAADDVTGDNGISSSGVDGLVDLSSNHQAVEKKLRSMQRKFNKEMKASGAAPIDFDKMNKKILAKLRKNTQSVLRGAGASARDVLASIGPVGGQKEADEEKVAKKEDKKPALKMTTGKAKSVNSGFSLDLENEGSNDALQAEEVLANKEAADAMNGEAQDDIVANKDVSIFKVISVRYLKSGFNKLLEEDK